MRTACLSSWKWTRFSPAKRRSNFRPSPQMGKGITVLKVAFGNADNTSERLRFTGELT